ncbi:hypothetical protein BVRB_020750 [Beta vulgaris subsp. vulgaris]|uniref:Uncharacterized protein n=1 Tax=Beta vulgaris subsp. vulgaris TaxID=3555 RepID=A0A0J8B0K3_BETVV|nr:hypothetical protein BVRB_020750 [Beta vulgaris subsp. vulgaris]
MFVLSARYSFFCCSLNRGSSFASSVCSSRVGVSDRDRDRLASLGRWRISGTRTLPARRGRPGTTSVDVCGCSSVSIMYDNELQQMISCRMKLPRRPTRCNQNQSPLRCFHDSNKLLAEFERLDFASLPGLCCSEVNTEKGALHQAVGYESNLSLVFMHTALCVERD